VKKFVGRLEGLGVYLEEGRENIRSNKNNKYQIFRGLSRQSEDITSDRGDITSFSGSGIASFQEECSHRSRRRQ
jgi:hypothetical protein